MLELDSYILTSTVEHSSWTRIEQLAYDNKKMLLYIWELTPVGVEEGRQVKIWYKVPGDQDELTTQHAWQRRPSYLNVCTMGLSSNTTFDQF